jgi:hypothetical protein
MSNPDIHTMRVFIAAPANQSLDSLKEELSKRNILPFTAYDLPPATASLSRNIEQAIKEADLIIAVVPAHASPNVFFEIGLAYALKKPFLLLVSPKYGHLPSDLAGTFYLRADPENKEAIGFALDQCMSRIERRVKRPRKLSQEGKPIGGHADKFLSVIQERGDQLTGRELEILVADLLREAGVEAVSESPHPQAGADIAVWSDALQPLVGNPLLIEVKSKIQTKHQLIAALEQVERYREKSGARLALLVVNTILGSLLSTVPLFGGVLAVTLPDLIERLRAKSFADTVRELRNQQVHGGEK